MLFVNKFGSHLNCDNITHDIPRDGFKINLRVLQNFAKKKMIIEIMQYAEIL